MEIGILGAAQSGKSALFQIMTGIDSRAVFGEPYVKGVAKIPDARFAKLAEIFKPAKVSPATIPFIDVNASDKDAWAAIRQNLSGVDGILHIIDAFTNDNADELVKRYRTLEDELAFSDLVIIENKLSRVSKTPQKSLKPEEAVQAKILPKAKELLESGKPLREMSFSPDEIAALRSFSFWTQRPELVVLNVKEGSKGVADLFNAKAKLMPPAIEICCQIEAEIAALPAAEQKDFLASMGIETPAFEKIIRAAFSLLGKICYFTVGEDEVKAWVVPAGSTAPKAASAIHKDFERGFIKAEVVSYEDFIACGGTLSSAKSSGKLRLEGKGYIVKDGDIISFRFNV
ncbi:MAG: redox-regulated ATPase YchF [Deltaproteobacteria bacterium]|nr:redox-regulated ATPase YchF [Deltaproteobacteria bacterium]